MRKEVFILLMVLAMVGWGASWVNVKVLSDYIGPYELVFLRYLITAVSMAPVLLILRKRFRIDAKTALLALVAAVLMIAYTKYFFLGTKLGTASLGGAFVTTLIPINTFLILVLFFGRPISKKDGFALTLGAVGVMSILGVWHLGADEVLTVHNLYFVLASLFWPLLTIVSSRSTRVSPLVFTFYMYTFTTLLSIPLMDISVLQPAQWDGLFWLNILTISVVSTTFSTTIYFMGIETLGSREVSTFIFLVPFAAIGLSALFLKEHISAWMLIGTLMTIVAVSMLNNLKWPRFLQKP
jgi:drug/metabolite transporter (DMT)-like permease